MLELELEWDDIDFAFAEFEREELRPIIRGMTVQLWNNILLFTPQFYGRMVASWNYTLNAPFYDDRSELVSPERDFAGLRMAREQGHPAAIAIANRFNQGHEEGFVLGNDVWFANGVDHGEGEYSEWVETADQHKLRPENWPGHPVERSLAIIESLYGSEMTEQQASRLKNLRIG